MSPKKTTVVGIDLGTTFSAIAHINEDTGKAEIIPSPEQDRITPSVVLIEKVNDIIVGEIAKQNAVAEPNKVVEFVKRQMGKPKEDKKDEQGNILVKGWCFEHEGKKYSAQEISAFILKKLKNDAEERLGTMITDAVITCPAYFGDPERAATKEAGVIAGFNVLAVIDEPVAAALSYGLDKLKQDQNVFVFDLGGGTFDVVILEIKGGKIREVVVNGDHLLGGKDWMMKSSGMHQRFLRKNTEHTRWMIFQRIRICNYAQLRQKKNSQNAKRQRLCACTREIPSW